MIKIEVYWGEIINPKSRQESNSIYMIIRPSIEDDKDYIKTYPDLESIVSEINHNPAGLDTMTTFPQEHKIIQYKNTIYSVYPLSDSERKNIESKLTGYKMTRKRK